MPQDPFASFPGMPQGPQYQGNPDPPTGLGGKGGVAEGLTFFADKILSGMSQGRLRQQQMVEMQKQKDMSAIDAAMQDVSNAPIPDQVKQQKLAELQHTRLQMMIQQIDGEDGGKKKSKKKDSDGDTHPFVSAARNVTSAMGDVLKGIVGPNAQPVDQEKVKATLGDVYSYLRDPQNNVQNQIQPMDQALMADFQRLQQQAKAEGKPLTLSAALADPGFAQHSHAIFQATGGKPSPLMGQIAEALKQNQQTSVVQAREEGAMGIQKDKDAAAMAIQKDKDAAAAKRQSAQATSAKEQIQERLKAAKELEGVKSGDRKSEAADKAKLTGGTPIVDFMAPPPGSPLEKVTPAQRQDISTAVNALSGAVSLGLGGKIREQTLRGITDITNLTGIPSEELDARGERRKADKKAYEKLNTMTSSVEGLEDALNRHGEVLVALRPSLPDTDVRKINDWLISGAREFDVKGLGDNAVRYGLALQAVRNEYARIIGGGAQSAGQTTVSAMQEAGEKMASGFNSGNTQAMVDQINIETNQRTAGYTEKLKVLMDTLKAPLVPELYGGGYQDIQVAPRPGEAPPPGTPKAETPPPGAKNAAPPAGGQQAKGVTINIPGKGPHTFPDQKAADAFLDALKAIQQPKAQ